MMLGSDGKVLFCAQKPLTGSPERIEEILAEVNADLLEEQAEFELKDAGRFFKRRRVYEKQREDPDDVYIEVERRESERKKQGLPTRHRYNPRSHPHDEVIQDYESVNWRACAGMTSEQTRSRSMSGFAAAIGVRRRAKLPMQPSE
jgi:hypothetical protein